MALTGFVVCGAVRMACVTLELREGFSGDRRGGRNSRGTDQIPQHGLGTVWGQEAGARNELPVGSPGTWRLGIIDKLPSLPTDNLYKFGTLAGIVLVVSGIAGPAVSSSIFHDRLDQITKDSDASSKVLDEEVAASVKHLSGEHDNAPQTIAAVVESIP